MTSGREIAMFPLGSAVLPGSVLPLHIFEPRYIQLLLDVQAGDGTFGTALITRGREAGTDEDQQREDVGTLVRIVRSERVGEDDDLRFGVLSVAESRLRIVEWLPDSPYPRALVEDVDEPAARPEHSPLVGEALALLADVLNLREQLGQDVGSPMEQLSDDPALASFQIAAVAGVGPLDAAALLSLDDLTARLERVVQSLRDTIEVLQFQANP